jgi:precorrin-3B C17-methyltransferase
MSERACLFVVGLGPGERQMMTVQAIETLRQAEVVVGYTGYFEWIADLVKGKDCRALPLGQETQRAELAVQLALEGRRTCVISSGDAGVYGMASLVLETVERQPLHRQPAVVVVPGVSALLASAALLGAPLGHDFAVISLSDLLTPWERIERRLAAAGEADFVLALLNPQSRRRDWQLRRAQEILLHARVPETPVGVVRNSGRPGQAVALTVLGRLAEAAVDMFTTVIVGNSQTRRFRDSLITPRGYRRESDADADAR